MPKTTKRWDHRQNIRGVFLERTNADKAIQAFQDLGVKEQDIEEVVSLNDTLRNGKILVIVHNVKTPAPIIDIFDQNKAQYNPDRSCTIGDDVAGLTVGALAGTAIGAAEGGTIGTIVAGPLGTALGAIVGAVVGGRVGAVAGEIAEHRK